VYDSDGGVWRFKCQACGVQGDVFDMRAKINGTTVEDELRKESENATPRRKAVAKIAADYRDTVYPTLREAVATYADVQNVWTYENAEGHVVLAVVRHLVEDHKSYKQISQTAGGYWKKAAPKPWPLYNLPRLAAADTVVIVEGEKSADALNALGIIATTTPDGAGKAEHADLSPLAGKMCILWPDNDDAGRDHMRDIQNRVEHLTPPATVGNVIIDDLQLPPKGDAYDFIAKLKADGFDRDTIRETVQTVIENAAPAGAAADFAKYIDGILAGKQRCIAWPWRKLTELSRALLPGTVTLLCGDPGSGKSFALLQALLRWHAEGHAVAIYELEEDRNYHLHRAAAMLANDSRLAKSEWMEKHADEVRDAIKPTLGTIATFARVMWEAPDHQASYEKLLAWVEERAKAGCEIIGIDPITAASPEKEPWSADLKFLMAAKTLMRKYQSRLILVTHPKKGMKTPGGGLDNMAGGAAYSRFSQNVLWLEKLDQPEDGEVTPPGFTTPMHMTFNRIFKIFKARNGPGTGAKLAFNFCPESLLFAEQGVLE
jgi:KaiC/GvpD/RAD55 family RecA-like ATPase